MKKIDFTMEKFLYEIAALVSVDKYKYSGKWVILRHCISGKRDLDKGKSIMEHGLNIASGSALYTATPLGRLDYNEVGNILTQNIEYLSPDSWESGVLIAVPVELINSKGEKIYWGEVTREYDSDKYHYSSIVDYFFKYMRGVDSRFILGYFEKEEDNNISFLFNEKFISFMDDEKKDKFYTVIKDILLTELGLPLISPNMNEDDILVLKEKYENIDMSLNENYILKTVLQLMHDYGMIDRKIRK